MSLSGQRLNDCGCCEGVTVQTPAEGANRHGLPALACRVGIHPQFKHSMLARLSALELPALARLQTRADDDFSVALLDAWATVADVLTFYQERIANEAYLRTATERRSILDLARLIGYELRPGVAAGTFLAFTLEDAPGAPHEVKIPVGVKVQSVPGPGEQSQTFETVEEIETRAKWNALRARIHEPWVPKAGDEKGWFEGTTTNLRPGDMLLFVHAKEDRKHWLWDAQAVVSVAPDHEASQTRVGWRGELEWHEGGDAWPKTPTLQEAIRTALEKAPCQVFALRRKAAVFGHNAANWRSLSQTMKQDYLGHEPEAWEKVEWPGYEIYAPQDPFSDQPPRMRHVKPTPEDIAKAANEAAESVAKAAEAEAPAAVLTAVSKTITAVQAIFEATKALGLDFKDASNDAISAMSSAYPAPGTPFDQTPLYKMWGAILDILSQFGLHFPIPQLGDFNFALPTPTWDEAKFGRFENPIGLTGGPDLLGFHDAINSALSSLSDAGISVPTLPGVAPQLTILAENLTSLIANNPAFLPFNTLKHFADNVLKNNPTNENNQCNDSLAKLNQVLTDALNAVNAANEIVCAAAGAGVSRAVAQALSETMKAALNTPPAPLPAPTPESVAMVARLTVKIAKYAALLAALPATTGATSVSFLQKLTEGLRDDRQDLFRDGADPFEVIDFVGGKLQGPHLLEGLINSLESSALKREFEIMDDEDRIAISVVLSATALGLAGALATGALGTGVLATGAGIGGAAVIGAGILSAAGLAAGGLAPLVGILGPVIAGFGYGSGLIVAALAVVVAAPGILGVLLGAVAGAAVVISTTTAMVAAVAAGASMAGAGTLTAAAGPLLLKAAKQMELAVVNAVNLALLGHNEDLPPRQLPERDYSSVDLDRTYQQVREGGWLVLTVPEQRDVPEKRELFHVERAEEMARAEFQLSLRVTRVKLHGNGLAGPFRVTGEDVDRLKEQGLPEMAAEALQTPEALNTPAGPDGRGFPDAHAFLAALDDFVLSADVADQIVPHKRDLLMLANRNPFHSAVRATSIFAESEKLPLAEKPITRPVSGSEVVLDRLVAGLEAGRTLIVVGKRARVVGKGLKISGYGMKKMPVWGSGLPMDAPLPGWNPIDEAGSVGVVTGLKENIDYAPAEPDDPYVAEVVELERASVDDNHTELVLKKSLENVYDRSTVTINANVARATHGETVKEEVLGGGDGSQAYQRFTLRQPPLTHVSASTPSGTESTLKLRVNDLEWREAPTLYGRGPNDRVFIARTSDEGKTTVQFGDGLTGARLPTGQENVRVTYRKGIGQEGLVKAGQLSLLMTRPLGVKAVTNPLDAIDADDRESLADARRNAPLTVLTLDRAVSLQDYEDFARAFAGIAKALATWTWDGRKRGVFITVAGPDGAEVKPAGDTYKNLLKALGKAGDPYVSFRMKSYRKALFRFVGKVKAHEDYRREKVLAEVEQALSTKFSFDERAFGRPVMLSEVIAVMQAVPGVLAVDVDKLYRADEAPAPNDRLPAALPVVGPDGDLAAAELLTLAQGPIEWGVMS